MTNNKCPIILSNLKINLVINATKYQSYKEKFKISTDKKMIIFIKQNNKLINFLLLLNSFKTKLKKKLKSLDNFKNKLID